MGNVNSLLYQIGHQLGHMVIYLLPTIITISLIAVLLRSFNRK